MSDYTDAPSAIRPTLRTPQRLVDTFPATIKKLRTLEEVRAERAAKAPTKDYWPDGAA